MSSIETKEQLQAERDKWIARARERTGNAAPVRVATLEQVFAADLRRYAGNPHDLDLHLRWLYESARSIGYQWPHTPSVEMILAGDSLYEREQLKRALQEGIADQRRYGEFRTLHGFHPDGVAHEHAKYFEQELDERGERGW